MSEDSLPTLPQPFGRYVLTRLIGEGGMAEVYQASVRVAEGLTKWVVIKKIRRDFADQREFTRMFVDEAKIALGLNHANIVQVFDFGQIGGTFYLAMELIEGLDLMRLFHAVKAQQDAFPAVIAAYVAHQVASGLSYAHRKSDEFGQPLGIVHRDVSPHNVMLSYDGQVKVLDFGIARTKRVYGSSREQAEAETIKGKVAYMSPEQALGRPVDARSDLYSLGVLLYELLTGELLYRTKDRMQALERVRTETLPPVLERAPDLPDELAHIVDRALARDPEQRYPNARAMQVELANFLHRADPVVDDETLRTFLERYRLREEAPRRGLGGSQLATREVADSHLSGMYVLGRSRASVRVVLLEAVFAPVAHEHEISTSGVNRLVEVVSDIAFKREAHVHRLDSGGTLLAFGTVVSTGDEADRCMRVAYALREAIGEAAPGIGLGLAMLATGVTVVRAEDGAIKLELPEGLDDELRRVATLVVDGHVLVSSELCERLAKAWRFGPSRYLDLPARAAGQPWAADLQEVAPLVGPLSVAERKRKYTWTGRAHLFGRELELKTLRDAFADAIRTPRSRSILVVGGPGMGKRALIERFVGSLPASACAVLRGTAQWSTRNQPLGVFLDVLRRFLGIQAATDLRTIERKLSEYAVREPDKLAEALAAALGSEREDARVRIDPRELRERLARLIRRLIRALAQRKPVVVVVENVHFVDEESARILEEWGHESFPLPVLGVCTARPGPRADALSRPRGVQTVELGELDDQARREMIIRRFERPEDVEGLADAILARTGGNPLFIEETLASLLHRGVIGWNAQARHLVVRERTATIEVPPTVEAALHARIDELAPDEREALQAGAVLGRTFRAGELPELLLSPDPTRARPPSDAWEDIVDRLVAEGFLERDDAATYPEPILRFRTVSLHEVCKSSIPPPQGEHLHGRAAEIKLSRLDYTPGRDDGPIAEHLVAAGRDQEAIEPAIRAARAAEDVAGNVEAYYYYSQALKSMGVEDPRRFDVLCEREPILRAWGRRRAQGADIRALLREAERDQTPKAAEREVIALARLLRFYLECGRTHRAARLVPRVEAAIRTLADPSPYLAVLGELESELHFVRGHFEEAEQTANDALAHCREDATGRRRRVRLLAALGRVQLGTGRRERAAERFREALALARDIGHRRLEAEMLNNLGEAVGRSTHYQEAVEYFKAALAIDNDLGDRFATGKKLANLGLAYTAIGLYRRAERYLRKALELHETIGHPGLLNDVMVSLGVAVANQGDHDAAVALLTDAARVARRRGDTRTELRAEVHLCSSESTTDPVAARIRASEVLERSRAEGLRSTQVRALHILAVLAAERGGHGDAVAFEREAVKLFRAGAAPLDGVRSLHNLGILLRDHPALAESEDEHRSLLREAATRIGRRLEELRDPELRAGYVAQPAVARILEDGGE